MRRCCRSLSALPSWVSFSPFSCAIDWRKRLPWLCYGEVVGARVLIWTNRIHKRKAADDVGQQDQTSVAKDGLRLSRLGIITDQHFVNSATAKLSIKFCRDTRWLLHVSIISSQFQALKEYKCASNCHYTRRFWSQPDSFFLPLTVIYKS